MMKNIFVLLLSLAFATTSFAQKNNTIVTDTIAVKGNCGQCKKRIENGALYAKGVKRAEWNKENQKLVVVFDSQKTDVQQIEKAIAEVGHDAGNAVADSITYSKLPACCAYRTTSCGSH